MKNVKFLIFTASIVALLSCSTTNAPSFDDDALVEEQTRSETSQTDSTKGGGVSATITPRDTVKADVVATEVPKDDVKNDSISCDSIPSDSIPTNELTLRI